MIKNPIVLLLALSASIPLFALTVGLDGWHNSESGNPAHYQWALGSGCDMGSYCGFGTLIQGLGNDTVTLRQALTTDVLAPVSVLIIVDPDTPSETASPNYITIAEADAVEAWVRSGGVLLMLANDMGNCEFTNLNVLADRFGIHFNADRATATGDLTGLPVHPFFEGCATIHWVNVCTMTLSDSTQAEFSQNSQVLAASTRFGLGRVLAFGDPIWYNEYLNTADNFRFAQNVVRWLTDTAGQSDVKKGKVISIPDAVSSVFVYDITGKRVAEFKTANDILWDGSGLSAGVYFIRLKTGNAVFTRKAILSR